MPSTPSKRSLLPFTEDESRRGTVKFVVLNPNKEDWWEKKKDWWEMTLKRIKIGPLQRQESLKKFLSAPKAIWTLASIMAPLSTQDSHEQDWAGIAENAVILPVQGHVQSVDMVLKKEVVFWLTNESIELLVQYRKTFLAKNTVKSGRVQEQLHQDFQLAIKRFVYSAPDLVLDELEEDGSGELPYKESIKVKERISGLMKIPSTLSVSPSTMNAKQAPLYAPQASKIMLSQHRPPQFIAEPGGFFQHSQSLTWWPWVQDSQLPVSQIGQQQAQYYLVPTGYIWIAAGMEQQFYNATFFSSGGRY
ncbi:hypothetical protein CDEST_01990 [Colletotrichum destructivum]|uniref:Uncharacterized protein n=1 Tax=Colletotrichum destructivum TaxID=34406 RepID=A0AAX4I1K8_9PEZI|nr:hypothetical protein CDEST_01990 [Colletotrichum destructivum]